MTSLIEKLLAVANGIPDDKVRHALGGAFLFSLIAQFGLVIAVVAVMVIAAAKEMYDSRHSDIHTSDPLDFAATCIGMVIGLICFMAGADWK